MANVLITLFFFYRYFEKVKRFEDEEKNLQLFVADCVPLYVTIIMNRKNSRRPQAR